MNKIHNIWLFLCRISTFCYLRFHGYKIKSNIYRFIWERKYKNFSLRTYSDIKQLGSYLSINSKKWLADSWEQMFDAVSYPGRVQDYFDGKIMLTSGNDCDEFAIYTASVLEKSLANGPMPLLHLKDPKFMTVTWMEGWKPTGHNVCLIKLFTHGDDNPDNFQYAYMDYGMPTGIANSPYEVAELIVSRYSEKKSKLIVYSVANTDLTPILVGKGKDYFEK